MRIVLDTNVLVSALLSPSGPPAEILRLVVVGRIELIVDARILAEYEEVLSRPKFGFDPDQTGHIIDFIEHSADMIACEPLEEGLDDKGDEPFAEAAMSAKAECLVTGNVKHYPAKRLPGLKVLSPEEFLKFCRK